MWSRRKLILLLCVAVFGTGLSTPIDKQNDSGNGEDHVKPKGCGQAFYSVSSQHTMCLHAPRRTSEGVTIEEQNLIRNFHNTARGEIGSLSGSTSSNQQQMFWDEQLSESAQKWASNCQSFHDAKENRVIPGKYPVGQNLALGMGHRDWNKALNIWYVEKADFEYGVGPRGYPPPQIGHYTQMVWADSIRLGCGYALCNKTTHFYVCNYGPAGNVAKWRDPSAQYKPYKLGPTGADCPHSFNKTSGLCDCGGKACYNGGKMNLKTCQCTCSDHRWINHEEDCSLKCNEAADIAKCASRGGPWGKKECAKFSNVPYDYCPITCGWCPYKIGIYWKPQTIPEFPTVVGTKSSLSTPGEASEKASVPSLATSPTAIHEEHITTSVPFKGEGHHSTADLLSDSNDNSGDGETTTMANPVRTDHKNQLGIGLDKDVEENKKKEGEGTNTTEEKQTYGSGSIVNKVDDEKKEKEVKEGVSIEKQETEGPISDVNEVEITLPLCSSIEDATCGQPSRSGYWGKNLCKNLYIQKVCPALCGICAASECVDYEGKHYKIGGSWITSFGRFTCTLNGVEHERGCMRSGIYLGQGETYNFEEYNITWSCKCDVIGFSYRLSCSGTRTGHR